MLCGCFGLASWPGLVLWKVSLFDLLLPCWQTVLSVYFVCLFFMIVETECVSASSFSLHLLPSSCFSYFLPNLPPCSPSSSSACSSFHPSPLPFHPHLKCSTFSFALPPSFFFPAVPPSVANPSDVLRVPACSVRTHTHLCSVSGLLS